MINLISTPNKTINGLDSRASAARSQLPFEFRREDLNIYYVSRSAPSDPTNPTPFYSLLNLTTDQAEFEIGDTVYFGDCFSAGQLILSAGIYVIEYSDLGGNPDLGLYRIRVNKAWSAVNAGYTLDEPLPPCNNLTQRPGYKLEAELLDENGARLVPFTFRYAPENSGRIFIDFGAILEEILELSGKVSQEFKVKYSEDWAGKINLVNYVITGAADGGGGLTNFDLAASYGDVTAFFPVGSIVEIDTPEYSGSYEITFVNFVSGRTFFQVLETFTQTSRGFAGTTEPGAEFTPNRPDFTANSPASSNVLGNLQINALTPSPIGEVLAGDAIFVTWGDPGAYDNGVYYCASDPVGSALLLAEKYNTGSSSATVSQAPEISQETDLVQAIYAERQIGQLGGSNLWEHLLRPGGTNIKNIDYRQGGKTLNPIETDLGDISWIEVSSARLITPVLAGELTGTFNVIKFNPDAEEPITSVDTIASASGRYFVTVTNFVAAGSYRVDMVGITAAGGVVIWNNGSVQVNGNQSAFVNINLPARAPDSPPAAEQFINVGIRFLKSSGNFDLQIELLLSAGAFLTWESYPYAKYLTKFQEPKTWIGFQRSLSILVDSKYSERCPDQLGLKYGEYPSDINKRFLSSQFLSGGQVFNTPYILQINLRKELTVPLEEFNQVRVFNNDFSAEMIERIYFRWQNPCKNGIYISWINSLGGQEEYLFQIEQEVTQEASAGIVFSQFFTQDIENVRGSKQRLNSENTQRILCLAERLTNNDIEALAEIKTSENVEAWIDTQGTERIQVITREELASGYNTRDNFGEFRLVIEFPDNYNFFEVKKY